MTTAVVNLKVTPFELQILDEALRLYTYAMSRLTVKKLVMGDSYHFDLSIGGDDPHKLELTAQAIRHDIGLK